MRNQFTGAPVPELLLRRILEAAHAAPSVGLSQPWDFIVVRDEGTRRRFWEHVQEEREAFCQLLEKEHAVLFAKIKIDGVMESTLSIVVTYDSERGNPGALGRNTIDDTGLYSVCLAIQNLWLAATAEGLGVGWVSFCREEFVSELLAVPSGIRPVAWLCVGPVTVLEAVPDLEAVGWRMRRSLNDAIHNDRW